MAARYLAVVLLPALATAAVERRGELFAVSGPAGTVSFRASDGGIASVAPAGSQASIWRSGPEGLWNLRLRDGSTLQATSPGVTCSAGAAGDSLSLRFRAEAAEVTVTATPVTSGVELVAEVTPRSQVALGFGLPARLRFAPGDVRQFVTPTSGSSGVGLALTGEFFAPQPEDHPAGWRHQSGTGGPAGYALLYGGPLDQKADATVPVALTVDKQGEAWLSPTLAGRLRAAKVMVNRPPARPQVDLVVVDSADGPWFSARHVGQGALWRIGGRVGREEAELALDTVMAAVAKLVRDAPPERRKVGLLALRGGPSSGGWAAVTVDQWRGRLRSLGCEVREYSHPKELAKALDSNEVLTLINPYGESLPVIVAEGLTPMLQRVGGYVRAGGNWFEVGGHPFYYALVPASFLSYGAAYPPAFADFFHLESTAGRSAVYGVQPQTGPWDRDNLFVPGRIACGGDEQGGWCERPFGVYLEPGKTWRSPVVRLAIGRSAEEALADYAAANRITRRLEAKMKAEVLSKFRDGVLVFYTGSAAEKSAHLAQLPPSTLIHFSDYLRGGFDKQYPDHLPPRPQFGTAAEFREFIDRAHASGHLIMPYTNPTWWCDDPKGPTFEREGTAPLLKTLDGKVVQERYANNTGFTITFWHAAVQAANRLTRRQFTEDFPVDVLFQDQCGARTWDYDTNPASPTPAAYADGMISLVDEDAAVVPLSTENGWDRVVNAEAQLCGLSWSMVPTEGGPEWRRPFQEDYRPELWRVYPLVQVLAHDKCSLLYHDLGQFVTNPRVASWTLGLGFGMSYRCSAVSLARPGARQWLYWVDRLQKSICSKYVGAGFRRFEHDRTGSTTARQDGVIRSAFGQVEVAANLDPTPRRERDRELAGYGFYATAPDTIAARLQRVGEFDCTPEVSFVTEATDSGAEAWVYSPARRTVAIELPRPLPGKVRVSLDGGGAQTVEGGRVVRFDLPLHPDDQRLDPPVELAAKAPREWPGGAPAVGVIDFGTRRSPSWTTIQPAAWLTALKEAGLPVKDLASPAEVSAALTAGVTRWLAIINPYGEAFPSEGPGQAQAMLARIREYVNHGGSWVETGGFSFYQGVTPEAGEAIGPAGLGAFGLPIAAGAVEAPPERLTVTETGRAWLGEDLAGRVGRLMSPVNRGLPRGGSDPGHLTLVAGEEADFIGGYRLQGWGYLWRIGGFNPEPAVAVPVLTAALRHLFENPPTRADAGRQPWLWHAVLTPVR